MLSRVFLSSFTKLITSFSFTIEEIVIISLLSLIPFFSFLFFFFGRFNRFGIAVKSLKLDFIHGYRGFDARDNIRFIDTGFITHEM